MSGAIGEAVRPEPFEPVQKTTLMLAIMAIILSAPLLQLAFPASK